MKRKTTGWLFVALQAVLLGTLILLPGRNDWTIAGWPRGVGLACILGGLAFVALAAAGLGPALTATPVPTDRGQLATGGLYRYVRHPIYSGVLVIVVGLTLRSGSLISLTIAMLTLVFFNAKAKWEEERLAERYGGYAQYAAATPRFVPRPWRTSGPKQ